MINVYICHTLHHKLPFWGSLIPTVMIYYLKTTSYYYSKHVYNSRKHEKMLLSNLIRNIKKVKKSKILWKKLLETMKRRLCYRTKSGKKNWKQVRQETVVSLIYRRVGGRVEHFCCEISVVFLWLICNFILLLFNGKGNNINITKK